MKNAHRSVSAAAAGFSIFLSASTLSEPAYGRWIAPGEHYCMLFYTHGSDCGFTSEAQCRTTAVGLGAQCFEMPSPTSSAGRDYDGSGSIGIRQAHAADASPVRDRKK